MIFNPDSLVKLKQCHPNLITLFTEVIKYFDCRIIEGYRNKEQQDLDYANKKTQLKWPNGKHNSVPSMAIDVLPSPVDYNDIERIYYFSGMVKGIASILFDYKKMSYKVRWGGDWNNDTIIKDNNFNDLSHYELVI